MLQGKRLAVLGVGTIGEALIKGLSGRDDVSVDVIGTVKRSESLERVRQLGVEATLDNRAAVAGRDVVVLAVKPQVMEALLTDLKGALEPKTLVISVAAGVRTGRMEELLGGQPVVRVMPNTPCVLGQGMSVLCGGTHASEEQLNLAQALFDMVGRTAVLDESLMDAVTGLSGSGPAYVYLVIESLAEAGVKVGIPRDVSTLLAAQTVLGSAEMVLRMGAHPALLKDAVTTPAGCTVDGLMELEEGKLRVTLLKAVVRATERARELG
ncbi:pyrroline-5-carboxylate reductase [Planctomycetota bacterium]|nr:pyrroline-5-carboxylate reductase [Planctomycetota bacterium]